MDSMKSVNNLFEETAASENGLEESKNMSAVVNQTKLEDVSVTDIEVMPETSAQTIQRLLYENEKLRTLVGYHFDSTQLCIQWNLYYRVSDVELARIYIKLW